MFNSDCSARFRSNVFNPYPANVENRVSS